ncbi:MAG: Na/Pi cotransporter family protein [Sinobacteraceae bacterium]|nr:Na/Pi cotransporter family protein [Nevskiaceae bacterium]
MAGDLNVMHMVGLLAAGLALFLLGLRLLTDGLKTIAGASLPAVLSRMTSNRFKGLFAGAVITALFNSSTITTVVLVGFVSAGLMTLRQCVPMIMGANIGSTFTAQIIAFNVSALTPFMIALGYLGYAFGRREILRELGGALLGLGLLFLGIQFMGEATHPLRSYQPFIDAMQSMENPLLGILIGAVFTAVVQSSAATLGIIIALASEGLMPLESAIPLILGANVGTVGTALLASIGKSADAARVGVVHLLFNVIGVLLFVFLIPQLADLGRLVSPSAPELEGKARLAAEAPRQVANIHTLFSVISTLVLIWFTGPLARLAELMVPTRRAKVAPAGNPRYLDEGVLAAPSLGLQSARLETAHLGELVVQVARRGPLVAIQGKPPEFESLRNDAREIARLASAILQYIGKLSQAEHTEGDSQNVIRLIETVNDLQSISDIVSMNLVATGEQRVAERVDLASLRDESTVRFATFVITTLQNTVAALADPNGAPVPVGQVKAEMDTLAIAARKSVLERLKLADVQDVLRFRLANDLIEQLRQIGRLSLRIAENPPS